MKIFIRQLSLFTFSFIIVIHSLIWLLEIPSRNAINKGSHKKLLKWNAIKNTKNQYDNIILGSSRGYCSYNPIIIDSIVGNTTFNMCTDSQNIIETYYILKETLKHQKPKTIIYEIFLPSFLNSPDFYHISSNASFMSQKGKLDMMLNGFKQEGILNLINPLLKYKPYYKSEIKNILNLKSDSNIKKTRYWINGYLFDNKIIDTTATKNNAPLQSKISISNIKFISEKLKLIISLCEKNNINLICVRAPYPKTRINATSKDVASIFFEDFLKENNVPFFDFNYYKNNNFYNSSFTDQIHMNVKGANKVSKLLGDILKVQAQ